MKLYIYSLENNIHCATVNGESNDACERKAEETYGSNDYGWTYSPAFGAADGIKENAEAGEIHINKNGETYYSKEDENGETIYSFTKNFEDIWDQETEDTYGE